ncbi:Ktr system potassium uptake protein A [uncultured Eubacterium sp.]|uniref:potassium channel family protein n=1 Tax=Brotomerdimonas butyrica TaxID=2981721 RepID=UPI000822678D|nr:TrkA family potassium uptake protein [Brotomerdimonas butyrica]MCU6756523.1 TrkA family potassium uptake protein [Brotomerdimonas butyrica]SCH88471.1 Ktr system potassium uptake protein A [uncultured Eubacterium sp.]
MFGRYKDDNVSYGIVGLGRFGYALAKALAELDADLLILDQDEEKIRDMREYTENALVIKNLDKASLMETGIQNCDIAIVCIGEQMDISILTTLHLVSMGIPEVVARATSAEHGEILEKLGAKVVYPERDMAERLAKRMEEANMPEFAQLNDKVGIAKLTVAYEMEEETVYDVDIETRFAVKLIAIESNSEILSDIDPYYEFKEDDVIYVLGNIDDIKKLTDWIEEN